MIRRETKVEIGVPVEISPLGDDHPRQIHLDIWHGKGLQDNKLLLRYWASHGSGYRQVVIERASEAIEISPAVYKIEVAKYSSSVPADEWIKDARLTLITLY